MPIPMTRICARSLGNFVAGLLVLAGLAGCTTLDRKNAVPQNLTNQSIIENMPHVRYKTWSSAGTNAMLDDIRKGMQEPGYRGDRTTSNYLALSGGGITGLSVQVC